LELALMQPDKTVRHDLLTLGLDGKSIIGWQTLPQDTRIASLSNGTAWFLTYDASHGKRYLTSTLKTQFETTPMSKRVGISGTLPDK